MLPEKQENNMEEEHEDRVCLQWPHTVPIIDSDIWEVQLIPPPWPPGMYSQLRAPRFGSTPYTSGQVLALPIS